MVLSVAQVASGPVNPTPSLIVPGLRVGVLNLGDTRDRALKLFPFKTNMDQEFPQEPDCGTELNWVDIDNPKGGNMFIRMRNNVVFQIDSATDRYRTAEGITVGSPPEEVRKHYPHLRSYVLSNITTTSWYPTVYWIDRDEGIAFAFDKPRRKPKRYLHEIIVFEPKSEVCPTDDSIHSPAKRELKPYSLDPSDLKAD
jgi:hypothetical protein